MHTVARVFPSNGLVFHFFFPLFLNDYVWFVKIGFFFSCSVSELMKMGVYELLRYEVFMDEKKEKRLVGYVYFICLNF